VETHLTFGSGAFPFLYLTDYVRCVMISVHCDDVELSYRGCMYMLLRKVRAGA
jgi:hypothetical protein